MGLLFFYLPSYEKKEMASEKEKKNLINIKTYLHIHFSKAKK